MYIFIILINFNVQKINKLLINYLPSIISYKLSTIFTKQNLYRFKLDHHLMCGAYIFTFIHVPFILHAPSVINDLMQSLHFIKFENDFSSFYMKHQTYDAHLLRNQMPFSCISHQFRILLKKHVISYYLHIYFDVYLEILC